MKPEHLEKWKEGVASWNAWRKENPNIEPDLSGAYLSDGGNNEDANLEYANLKGANMEGINLRGANLSHCKIRCKKAADPFLRKLAVRK